MATPHINAFHVCIDQVKDEEGNPVVPATFTAYAEEAPRIIMTAPDEGTALSGLQALLLGVSLSN